MGAKPAGNSLLSSEELSFLGTNTKHSGMRDRMVPHADYGTLSHLIF